MNGVRPVIFLDFDGVICSPRAFTAQEKRWSGREYHELRWADPVACDLVGRLAERFNCWIVVSSTWRSSLAACTKILGRYKLDKHLHDDWRTGKDPQSYRGKEVRTWLAEHGNPPYLILDDDSDFDADMSVNLVKTDGLEGMMLRHFAAAERHLEAITARATQESERS